MRLFIIFIQIIFCFAVQARESFAFTHFSTADGSGLASNMVNSLYQDQKGFIWVGTANGLQRFDGSKFIDLYTSKKGSDELPHANISQIIPADSGRLILAMRNLGEFGIFDPSDFTYRKISIRSNAKLPPRAEYRIWKSASPAGFTTPTFQ